MADGPQSKAWDSACPNSRIGLVGPPEDKAKLLAAHLWGPQPGTRPQRACPCTLSHAASYQPNPMWASPWKEPRGHHHALPATGRGKGIGSSVPGQLCRALVGACTRWGRQQGCLPEDAALWGSRKRRRMKSSRTQGAMLATLTAAGG